MLNYLDNYNFWSHDEFFDQDIREELASLDLESDKKEIEDRFYCDLEFGTGGLRGIMGAGTNRMNQYTVAKATAGLGNYLFAVYGESVCRERGAVICYDTRNNSRKFAETAANVLSAKNIKVYLFTEARPTPQLSYAVKALNCVAGVVITASHNPKEYNGYKVYDEYGCQLIPAKAEQVISYVNAVTDYRSICFEGNDMLIKAVDVTDGFVREVMKQSMCQDKEAKENLHVIYTPLHGTGYVPVCQALALDGFNRVEVVEEQEKPDGNFPTVASPNPEDRRALEIGIAQAEKTDADIVLGTDPDSDRVGVAVKTKNGYMLMTGNQIGALLVDFVLSHTDIGSIYKPAVVKTVVTSELGAEIAKKYGCSVFSTLTGFKFIGEKITQFEKAGKEGSRDRDYTFIIGYEESYGYLAGTHARDKDAVVSSLLICEMAAEYKKRGITIFDRMKEIYCEYGYYRDALDSFTLKGKDGLEKISAIMADMRNSKPLFDDTIQVIDYSIPVKAEKGFGTLPVSNVLKYILKDGSWIAVRPSGTEPKIKIYYSIKGANKEEAEQRLFSVQRTITDKLGLLR